MMQRFRTSVAHFSHSARLMCRGCPLTQSLTAALYDKHALPNKNARWFSSNEGSKHPVSDSVESISITPREKDYSQWYLDVIAAAQMAENSPVKGCMIIRPWGMAIWDTIREELNTRIKATGTENAYFPLFIPLSFISKVKCSMELARPWPDL